MSTATFNAAGTNAAGQFSASIDWGDGTSPSTGTVSTNVTGFKVVGTHEYVVPNQVHDVKTTVKRVSTGATVSSTGHASVHPNSLTIQSQAVADQTAGKMFTATLASFVDGNSTAQPNDYLTDVDWGDGSKTNADLSFTPGVPGGFDLNSTHNYVNGGFRRHSRDDRAQVGHEDDCLIDESDGHDDTDGDRSHRRQGRRDVRRTVVSADRVVHHFRLVGPPRLRREHQLGGRNDLARTGDPRVRQFVRRYRAARLFTGLGNRFDRDDGLQRQEFDQARRFDRPGGDRDEPGRGRSPRSSLQRGLHRDRRG